MPVQDAQEQGGGRERPLGSHSSRTFVHVSYAGAVAGPQAISTPTRGRGGSQNRGVQGKPGQARAKARQKPKVQTHIASHSRFCWWIASLLHCKADHESANKVPHPGEPHQFPGTPADSLLSGVALSHPAQLSFLSKHQTPQDEVKRVGVKPIRPCSSVD